ncbi:MAG: YaiI/YqxD family protein [Gammaproteobacteria bacterium]|jgi:uncharacterized protein YaiI (UPF0178 family)|nr:YaiI/YqxD family protein [Gammaproteobacteria bacterium]MBQ0773430.1 YaiI/YqxD family protein [Gammaproteobacteria bacterium]|tara:strand:- start:146438 stop:146887 length:450 start_codon:yes stop_codon:yes gene_type:complete
MPIWVDADACPKTVRDIVVRAAQRAQVVTTFVANQRVVLPPGPYLKAIQVSAGFDVADDEIVARVSAADLVITQDIPLAAEVIEKGAVVVTPRGELMDKENVRARLNIRDFMDTMRASGVQTGGPPPLSQTDRQAFANILDRYLAGSLK